MYILHFAKSASEVRNTIVGKILTNSCSAVPNIMIKLVTCNDINILAFIIVCLELFVNGVRISNKRVSLRRGHGGW